MKKSLLSVLTALAIIAPATATLADETVSLKAAYQSLSATGSVRSGPGGSSIDLDRELGLQDSNDVSAELALNFGDFRLSASYLALNHTGSRALNSKVTFNGTNFNVSDQVSTDLNTQLYDLTLSWLALNFDDIPTRFQLGLDLSAKLLQSNPSLRSTLAGTSEVSSDVVLPTIGLRTRIALADFIGLVARVHYIGYKDNRFVDAEAQIEFSPIPLFGLYAGYRQINIKADAGSIKMDSTFAGPFIGLLARI